MKQVMNWRTKSVLKSSEFIVAVKLPSGIRLESPTLDSAWSLMEQVSSFDLRKKHLNPQDLDLVHSFILFL